MYPYIHASYAIVDTQHPDYQLVLAEQSEFFSGVQASSTYVPILNLAGTQALIKVFVEPPESDCVVFYGEEEVPLNRNMTEWEIPFNP